MYSGLLTRLPCISNIQASNPILRPGVIFSRHVRLSFVTRDYLLSDIRTNDLVVDNRVLKCDVTKG